VKLADQVVLEHQWKLDCVVAVEGHPYIVALLALCLEVRDVIADPVRLEITTT
jgi:hypothetical protein